MRWLFRASAVAAALLSVMGASASASPWGRRAGDGFVLTRVDYFTSRGDFLVSSPIGAADQFDRLELNAYAEYGVKDRLMVGGNILYGRTRIRNAVEEQTRTGISEIEGFVQGLVRRKGRGATSLQLLVAAPQRFESGARPELVSDGIDLEFRVRNGDTFAFTGDRVFLNLETAYRRRFGNGADQIRADTLLGIDIHPRLMCFLESFSTISVRNNASGGADFDVYRLQPSFIVKTSGRTAVQAGAIFDVAGRNFSTGRTVFLGLWTNF